VPPFLISLWRGVSCDGKRFNIDTFDSGVEPEANWEAQPGAIQLGDPVVEKVQKSIQKHTLE
jgi:hypothetical protein